MPLGIPLVLPAGKLAGNSKNRPAVVEPITVGNGLHLEAGVLSSLALGTSGIDGAVDTFDALPVDGGAELDAIFIVRQSSGVWLINRKQRGLYQRIATTGDRNADWQYLGEWLEEFSDENFNVYNSADQTKAVRFDLSRIDSNTLRKLTVPENDGTLVVMPEFVTALDIGGGRFLTLNDDGQVVYADSSLGIPALGYTRDAVSMGQKIRFAQDGLMNGLYGLTPGEDYYLGTLGLPTLTPPSTGLVQAVGKAVASDTLLVELGTPVLCAA